MKKCRLLTAIPLLIGSSLSGVLGARAGAHDQGNAIANTITQDCVIVPPDGLKWQRAGGAVPPGAQMVTLMGDPSRTGSQYTVRFKFPDGYKLPPHYHPEDIEFTVLQGISYMGTGETWDSAKFRTLPTGSYGLVPKGVRHFELKQGETIEEAHGIGPLDLIYVKPEDDPRHKATTK